MQKRFLWTADVHKTPGTDQDVSHADMCFSAGCMSHSAAIPNPQGVSWSAGHLIYADSHRGGKEYDSPWQHCRGHTHAAVWLRMSHESYSSSLRGMLLRLIGGGGGGVLTCTDGPEDTVWICSTVAAPFLHFLLWQKAAVCSRAARAARLIVLSCGQVISELLVLITPHYHRIPREDSVSCKVVSPAPQDCNNTQLCKHTCIFVSVFEKAKTKTTANTQ